MFLYSTLIQCHRNCWVTHLAFAVVCAVAAAAGCGGCGGAAEGAGAGADIDGQYDP